MASGSEGMEGDVTREEAIELVNKYKEKSIEDGFFKRAEALQMAVEDMKIEPCEDAISRSHFDERVRLAGGMANEELTQDFKDGVLTVLEMLKTEPHVNPILKEWSGIVNKDANDESKLTKDLISRQAVLEILDHHTLSRMAEMEINELPSVECPFLR